MKKIIVLAHNFSPAKDGGSILLGQIADFLKSRGNEVKIFTSDSYSSDDYINPEAKRITLGWGREKGMAIYRIKTFRRARKFFRFLELFFPLKKAREFFSLFRSGPVFLNFPFSLIRREKPDLIVNGVFPTAMPLYAQILKRITRAGLFLVPCFHLNDPVFRGYPLINILKQAEGILALTKAEKDFYVRELKIKADRIFLFRPTAPKELLLEVEGKAKFSRDPTLLFLGSHSYHKQIELLIEAFKDLKREFQNLKLIIAGKETLYTPEIKKKIEGMKNIFLISNYDLALEKKLLDQAWALINPSLYESFGLVFLEAWARKKPVIASDLEAIKGVVDDGKNGLLFKSKSKDDLIRKTALLLSDKNMIKKMGERGYAKLIKTFSQNQSLEI